MSSNVVSVAVDRDIAVVTVNNPPVNTITAGVREGLFAAVADIRARSGLKTVHDGILKYRDQFGPMHWEPAPLLTRLVTEGRTLRDWDQARN